MYPKPKSAPARILKSKFIKSKTTAMKEMEAWVKKDDDPLLTHESLRVGGQLNDNVTEERMLRAKLWELSKERYKFLAQNAYEKKIFQDRMQRRANALLRRPSTGSLPGRHSVEKNDITKSSWRNARLSDLSQLASTKEDIHGRYTTINTTKTPAVRPGGDGVFLMPLSTSHPADSTSKISYSNNVSKTEYPPIGTQRPLPGNSSDSRNVKFNKVFVTEIDSIGRNTSGAALRPSKNFLQNNFFENNSSAPTIDSADSNNLVSAPGHLPTNLLYSQSVALKTDGSVLAWNGKNAVPNKYGMRFQSSTKDPRYMQLEKSLAQVEACKIQTNIRSIIDNLESLHIPPRMPRESKPKTERMIVEYIREQGFAF